MVAAKATHRSCRSLDGSGAPIADHQRPGGQQEGHQDAGPKGRHRGAVLRRARESHGVADALEVGQRAGHEGRGQDADGPGDDRQGEDRPPPRREETPGGKDEEEDDQDHELRDPQPVHRPRHPLDRRQRSRRRDDTDREVLLGQELDGGEDPEGDEQSPDEVAGAMREDDRPDGRAGQGEDGRVAAEAPGIDGVGDLPRRREHGEADHGQCDRHQPGDPDHEPARGPGLDWDRCRSGGGLGSCHQLLADPGVVADFDLRVCTRLDGHVDRLAEWEPLLPGSGLMT